MTFTLCACHHQYYPYVIYKTLQKTGPKNAVFGPVFCSFFTPKPLHIVVDLPHFPSEPQYVIIITHSTCLECGNISIVFMHFYCIFMRFIMISSQFICISRITLHKYYIIIIIASRGGRRICCIHYLF